MGLDRVYGQCVCILRKEGIEENRHVAYHRFEGVVRHRLGVLQPRRPAKEGDKSEKSHPSLEWQSGRDTGYSRAFFTHHGELMVNDNVKMKKV